MKKLAVSAVTFSIALLIGLPSVLAASASSPEKAVDQVLAPLTREERLKDFDYLVKVVQENYPHLWAKQRLTGVDWRTRTGDFRKAVETSPDDTAFYKTLRKLVGGLQNSHTSLLTEDWLSTYKKDLDKLGGLETITKAYTRFKSGNPASMWSIRLSYKAGEYWVTGSRLSEVPVGSTVLAIDGVDVNTYARRQMDRAVLLVDKTRKQLYVKEMPLPETEKMVLTLDKEDGGSPRPILVPTSVPVAQGDGQQPEPNVTTRILEPDKSAYIKVVGFASDNMEKDAPVIREFLNSIRNYETLVIDIRGNGGGADAYWRDLLVTPLLGKKQTLVRRVAFRNGSLVKAHLQKLMGIAYYTAREPKASFNAKALPQEVKGKEFAEYIKLFDTIKPLPKASGFKGSIKLLVDDGVYSAAETFAWFAKSSGWATLVGTDTGGDGIGMDPMLVVLPASKLVVRLSPTMGLNPDGSSNEENKTEPDIHAEQTTEEIKAQLVSSSDNPSLKPDNVVKSAIGQGTGVTVAKSATVNTTAYKPVSAGFTVYPGYTMEPGVKITVTPPYAGDHAVGAVVDTMFFKPGVFYAGKRYFTDGFYLFDNMAYTAWPGLGDPDQPTYGFEHNGGLRWVSGNGQSTARFGLMQRPAETLPAYQGDTESRTEVVASGLATMNAKDTTIQAYAKWSKDLRHGLGLIMGGADMDYRLTNTNFMHLGIAGGTSDRQKEFSINNGTGHFSVPGADIGDFAGNQVIKGSAGIRYRPLQTAGIVPTAMDFWFGPQVDIGWVGYSVDKTEFNAVSAGLATSLTLGTPADSTSLTAGVALPLKKETAPKFYVNVTASIF